MNRLQESECSLCSSQERWLLHNVRHRGMIRRLCTSCVLRQYVGLFCPVCLEVYEGSSLPYERVVCQNCPSLAHKACVSKDKEPHSPYVCTSCVNPNFVFFDLRKKKGEGGGLVELGNERRIDEKLAKVLVVAARFAADSMSRAALALKMEAGIRVKEAALARKRARDALEIVAAIEDKEKEKEKEKEKKRTRDGLKPEGDAKSNGITIPLNEKSNGIATPSRPEVNAKSNGVTTSFDDKSNGVAVPLKLEGNKKSNGVVTPLKSVSSKEKEKEKEKEKKRVIGSNASHIIKKSPKKWISIAQGSKLIKSPDRVTSPARVTAAKEKKSIIATNVPSQIAYEGKDKNGSFSVPLAAPAQHPNQDANGTQAIRRNSKPSADSGARPH